MAAPTPATLPPIRPGTKLARMTTTLTLTVNGESRAFDAPLTVATLLDRLELDRRKVAVELNEEIVHRSRYTETALSSGDSLEIVHFIGGG